MDIGGRVENQSWAITGCVATSDRHGNDVALVVARVAYAVTFAGKVTLAYRPVRWSDVADGHGGVRYPADLAAEKPGTDLGLVGTAHPPRNPKDERFLAWVTMGPLRKAITVVGPRKFGATWGKIAPGNPEPVGPTPLRYDLCFGGVVRTEEGTFQAEEPNNPIGRGFATDEAKLLGAPAPQLEPVADPLAPKAAHRSHGCFAPLPAHWDPRRLRIGTRDEAWQRKRAPIPPRDFDTRFHCWAPPELHSDKPLTGDEPIEVGGVLPEGTWRFSLPRYEPIFGIPDGDGWRRFPTHLDGVLIDADERVVELTWRAAIPLPNPWEKLARMRVWTDAPMPREVIPGATPPAKEPSPRPLEET